jgi:hypothetical protein
MLTIVGNGGCVSEIWAHFTCTLVMGLAAVLLITREVETDKECTMSYE